MINHRQRIKNNTLHVKITPNAPQTELRSSDNNILKIAVAAPPEKNKANHELIRFFKKQFNINVRIKSGAASRQKILEITQS